ncbi:hypothetical protein COT42_06030 [Candidatus Saganbacteria bacterium CG08_land_8_20_14_0_20_45_16]|uniref:Uncharacterized protein n=1 Tax=Candidatus Saganbacteria bacterium CG08_land_8_20_14_0_20_45_16 TaxID=2014293 RepID=A0A2H0XW71_UNCSA|nr:MAG: hypothetical protein COT42_06030 [Candidatus Saganbacteria bacterium CG08_land_8_20_14_0_20_45_16]
MIKQISSYISNWFGWALSTLSCGNVDNSQVPLAQADTNPNLTLDSEDLTAIAAILGHLTDQDVALCNLGQLTNNPLFWPTVARYIVEERYDGRNLAGRTASVVNQATPISIDEQIRASLQRLTPQQRETVISQLTQSLMSSSNSAHQYFTLEGYQALCSYPPNAPINHSTSFSIFALNLPKNNFFTMITSLPPEPQVTPRDADAGPTPDAELTIESAQRFLLGLDLGRRTRLVNPAVICDVSPNTLFQQGATRFFTVSATINNPSIIFDEDQTTRQRTVLPAQNRFSLILVQADSALIIPISRYSPSETTPPTISFEGVLPTPISDFSGAFDLVLMLDYVEIARLDNGFNIRPNTTPHPAAEPERPAPVPPVTPRPEPALPLCTSFAPALQPAIRSQHRCR